MLLELKSITNYKKLLDVQKQIINDIIILFEKSSLGTNRTSFYLINSSNKQYIKTKLVDRKLGLKNIQTN